VVADISARRHAEALLREREALLSAVFAHMTEAVVLLALTPGASPRIVTANRAAGELIAPGSLPGSNGAIGAPFPEALTKLMPMPAERVAGFVARVEATAHATGPTTFMDVLPTRAGPRQFESSIVPVRGPDGVVSHVLWTGRDVTEKTRQEEALRASLEEKETLMREIHHRVKNNFQLVSSLLSLQERADGDARLAEAFERARARIRAMSSVHERLYGSSSVSHLDFGAHLRELVEALAPAASGARVSCETDDGVTVDIETAIPLGLISAELVTNALKHAYPAGAPGPIEVRLLLAGDRLVLSVADQGAGLPADFTPDASRSLGVRLVESLSRQLDAEVTWTRENGTRVTVSLPRRARASET
jgi:two-component sensor histidine kinase